MRIETTLLIAVLAAGAGCERQEKAALPPAAGPGAPPLPDLEVPRGRGPKTAAPTDDRATGTLYARKEAKLGPHATGVIDEILVEEGERVRKGQVLFRLDARDATLRRDQARAALEAARVSLRGLETEVGRTRVLFEQNAVNRQTWEQLENKYESARVGLKQAEVALAMAEKMLADTVVRAPFDGIVTTIVMHEGETATLMPPSVVLILQDQDVLELKFRLPERALARIHEGDVVRARIDALSTERDAKVIRVQPTVDPRTRTIEVVAQIDNRDGVLRPGLLAEIEISRPVASPPPAQAASPAPTPTVPPPPAGARAEPAASEKTPAAKAVAP